MLSACVYLYRDKQISGTLQQHLSIKQQSVFYSQIYYKKLQRFLLRDMHHTKIFFSITFYSDDVLANKINMKHAFHAREFPYHLSCCRIVNRHISRATSLRIKPGITYYFTENIIIPNNLTRLFRFHGSRHAYRLTGRYRLRYIPYFANIFVENFSGCATLQFMQREI